MCLGRVGQTFKTINSIELQIDNAEDDAATYQFSKTYGGVKDSSKGREDLQGVDLVDSRYAKSRWCYDSPGLMNPEQVVVYIGQKE